MDRSVRKGLLPVAAVAALLVAVRPFGASQRAPAIALDSYCAYLVDVGRQKSEMSCLADPEVAAETPRSLQALEDEIAADEMRRALELHCLASEMREADLLRGGGWSGSDGDPVTSADDLRVQSCVNAAMLGVMADSLATLAGLDLEAISESRPTRADERVWLINGESYNDPWGFDYKNDDRDQFGDGR